MRFLQRFLLARSASDGGAGESSPWAAGFPLEPSVRAGGRLVTRQTAPCDKTLRRGPRSPAALRRGTPVMSTRAARAWSLTKNTTDEGEDQLLGCRP